ncbi:MAG: 50S ribosomal protein L21 [Spirochaetaceae bacterium]|jgi:large subunit ribosomal protein L21
MYALVEIGGKQYKAQEGSTLRVDRLSQNEGDVVEFDSVLMVRNDDDVKVGAPYVSGAAVRGVVEEHIRDRKVIVYKYKRRKNYARKRGHRQQYSVVRVREISG